MLINCSGIRVFELLRRAGGGLTSNGSCVATRSSASGSGAWATPIAFGHIFKGPCRGSSIFAGSILSWYLVGTCYFLRLMSLHVPGQVLKDETFLERIDGPEELPICTLSCSHILCTALYRFNSLDRKHFTDAVRCCFICFFPVFWCMLQLC